MSTLLDNRTVWREQRAAMFRVFGGTALAFVALLVAAVLVKPELMQMAIGIVTTMMTHAGP